MLSLSLVSDPIRDALNAQVRHFSTLVGWATLVVAVGVALEGVEIVHDIIVWCKRKRREKRERSDLREVASIFPTGEVGGGAEPHSDHPRWVKRFTRIGLILVVVGVVAEWRCGAKLEDAHNAVHEYDLAKLTEADQKARSAAESAKTAHDEADAVKKETDALTLRLEAASRQLTDLEQDTLALSPRWRLLELGEDTFVKALKPFPGQRVATVSCGNPDTDRFRLEELFLQVFAKAGWSPLGMRPWPVQCLATLSGGNEIFFVPISDSDKGPLMKLACGKSNVSRDAVHALCDVLNRLKIFTTAWELRPLPKDAGIRGVRNFFGFGKPGGPAEMAYQDPGTIFILVNPSTPMFADKKKKAQRSSPPTK